MEEFVDLFALSYPIIIIIFVLLFILSIPLLVLYCVGMWKLYVKAGEEGWKAIIPFYNKWVLFSEMLGLKWWWFVAVIVIPIVSNIFGNFEIPPLFGVIISAAILFVDSIAAYNSCIKIGKRGDIGYMLLLTLLPDIGYPVLGYLNNVVWNRYEPVSENSYLDKDKVVTPAPNNTNNTANTDTVVYPSVIPAEEVQKMSSEQSEQK